MSLEKKIEKDFIQALRSKNQVVLGVLRLLKSVFQNKEIEKKAKLKDEDVIKVLMSEVKKRKDSIEQFKKGERNDLVAQEEKEIEIIDQYLPEMKSSGEIKKIICDIIEREKIERSVSNFGQLMKLAMQELSGQAEGNLVSEIVKEELSKSESL